MAGFHLYFLSSYTFGFFGDLATANSISAEFTAKLMTIVRDVICLTVAYQKRQRHRRLRAAIVHLLYLTDYSRQNCINCICLKYSLALNCFPIIRIRSVDRKQVLLIAGDAHVQLVCCPFQCQGTADTRPPNKSKCRQSSWPRNKGKQAVDDDISQSNNIEEESGENEGEERKEAEAEADSNVDVDVTKLPARKAQEKTKRRPNKN